MNHILFLMFLIFCGAAVLSTLALMTRQSMLVAYMLLGIVLGPWGIRLIQNPKMVSGFSDIGIIFLLFLLGLDLPLKKLVLMFKKITWVAVVSSIIFAAMGYIVAYYSGYTTTACWVVSAAMVFSSTIIGIKLLPTTVLHHQHTGEVMISILLLQDFLAILVLLLLNSVGSHSGSLLKEIGIAVIGFPAILLFSYCFNRFVLLFLFSKFNRIKEYLFLLAIAWCLSMAQLATVLGLSTEIGAFIAGVSLASCPVSVYIAESLKPVRDFFLVLFFVAMGATFDLNFLPVVILPALVLLGLVLLVKPFSYWTLLKWSGEASPVSWEVGVRLAQISEFSLIIATLAFETKMISSQALYLIEAATLLSFMVSSYWVVMKYPTPVAMVNRLRRD